MQRASTSAKRIQSAFETLSAEYRARKETSKRTQLLLLNEIDLCDYAIFYFFLPFFPSNEK